MMKTNSKASMYIGIVLLSVYVLIGAAVAMVPIGTLFTIDSVIITPEEPTRLGELTISAQFSGEELTEIYVLVQECTPTLCYSMDELNVSMTLTGEDTYEATLTLTKDDATYIKYAFNGLTVEGWEQTEYVRVNLSTEINNGDTNGDGDNGDGNGSNNTNGTPGFEVLVVLTAISIIAILINRKRYQ